MPDTDNSAAESSNNVASAVAVINAGGVIAYPTEYCFGLGCDPRNQDAVSRILKIKQRSADQGLILVAANQNQVADYVSNDVPLKNEISASWPGPNTWLLPRFESSPRLISGHHQTIAIRVSAHSVCQQLCIQFGGAIVSTSANRHGEQPIMSADELQTKMGLELDFILSAELGGAESASKIRDGVTGAILR